MMTKRTVSSQLKRKAFETIKSRILLNILRPGESLVENDLSFEFGLSRTPIREILAQLEYERLVRHTPYMGTYVTQLTKEDSREIYEIRGVLEAHAARTSVMRITEQEINEMELIYEQAREELKKTNGINFINEFRKIHDLIVFRAGNQRLTMFIHALDNESQRIVNCLYNSPDCDLEKPLIDKFNILLAIKSRDTEKVVNLIKEHYENSIHIADNILPNRNEVPEYIITPFFPILFDSTVKIPVFDHI